MPEDTLQDSPAVTLPPLLTPHLAEPGDAVVAVARRGIAEGLFGAGDVVLAPALTTAAMALVLEPEVPAATAREMAPLAMVAAAEALGALLPPKVAIEHRWPGTVLLNGGAVADVSVTMAPTPPDGTMGAIPDWLIIGIEVRTAYEEGSDEPGADVGTTCVAEEGGAEILPEQLLSTIAAHLLVWLDVWQSDGSEPVARAWLFRAKGRDDPATIWRPDGARVGRVLALLPDARLKVAFDDGTEAHLEWPCPPPTAPTAFRRDAP